MIVKLRRIWYGVPKSNVVGSVEAIRNSASLTPAPHDQVKFVLASRRDYEFAREFTRAHDLPRRVAAVIFSPVHGGFDLQALAAWILEDRLDVRFGYQLHKLIWGPEARGV